MSLLIVIGYGLAGVAAVVLLPILIANIYNWGEWWWNGRYEGDKPDTDLAFNWLQGTLILIVGAMISFAVLALGIVIYRQLHNGQSPLGLQ